YDRYAALLSLGQDPRWRRFLVSRVDTGPRGTVLDVATGTGAVARELLAQRGCTVVGLDQSPEMLAEARRRLPADVKLVEGRAEGGDFLGPSIRAFYARYPEERLLELWYDAGIRDVRSRRLSLGGGIVTWGRRA